MHRSGLGQSIGPRQSGSGSEDPRATVSSCSAPLNQGGRFYRSGAGARSLTEVVAAGIKKLEPVEAADFGRVEIERPEHEAGTTLGPEERRLARQPFTSVDHVTDPRGVGRIPEACRPAPPEGSGPPSQSI